MHRLVLIVALLGAGIGSAQQPETLSLLGKPLFAPSIDADTRKQLEADLAAARAAYKEKPSPDTALRVGDIDTSLGRYGDAIEIYTRAIEAYPDDARLYARRGKDFITFRKFDLAVRDLSKAVQPAEGKPAAANPGVHYDLGLAYYLKGEFAPASAAFRAALKGAEGAETTAPSSFWLYVSLQRLHKADEAKQIAEQFSGGTGADDPYVRLLQFYKGALAEGSLEAKGADGVTLAYGAAVRGLWSGAIHDARMSFKRIVEKDDRYWTMPAYIAAEAELSRLTPGERKKLKLK